MYELGDLFLDLLTLFVSFYLMAGQDKTKMANLS